MSNLVQITNICTEAKSLLTSSAEVATIIGLVGIIVVWRQMRNESCGRKIDNIQYNLDKIQEFAIQGEGVGMTWKLSRRSGWVGLAHACRKVTAKFNRLNPILDRSFREEAKDLILAIHNNEEIVSNILKLNAHIYLRGEAMYAHPSKKTLAQLMSNRQYFLNLTDYNDIRNFFCLFDSSFSDKWMSTSLNWEDAHLAEYVTILKDQVELTNQEFDKKYLM